MENTLGSGSRVVLSGNQRDVLIGILDLAVADIREHGDHGQVIHLHHFQELLRAKHLFLIGTPATNAAMDVGVTGKPAGRLRSRGGLRIGARGDRIGYEIEQEACDDARSSRHPRPG